MATDKEGDVLTYVLLGAAASNFAIDAATGQLRTKDELDFDVDPTMYAVMVRATDPFFSFTSAMATPPAGNADIITVNITVTNVKEAPTFSTGAIVVALEEYADDTVLTTMVGPVAYDADDPDGMADPGLTLSGPDSSKFAIDRADGVLTFKAKPNFESPVDANRDNTYEVSVVATDSDGQASERDVIITVTNVDEDGTVTLSAVQPRIGVPITATLTDPDGDISNVSWVWTNGSDTLDEDDAKKATYTPVADDNGKTLTATATYTDGHGPGKEKAGTSLNMVVVDNRNRAPEFPDLDRETEGRQTATTREVAENTAAAADIADAVAATDPNTNDSLTYTLGGPDAASFDIVVGSGQLMTKAALNREVKDTYTVTVKATDSYGLSAATRVTIMVTNEAEDPEVSGPATASYDENGTGPVATYTATDDEDDKTGTALTCRSLEPSPGISTSTTAYSRSRSLRTSKLRQLTYTR